MTLNQLTSTGGGAYGVSLPKDDLRQLGLLDADDHRQQTTLRVESVIPGVWLVAPTSEVDQQAFNAMKFAAYEAATPDATA